MTETFLYQEMYIMNSDILRLILIALLALGLFYLVSGRGLPIQNAGEVVVNPGPSDLQQGQLPQFVPEQGYPSDPAAKIVKNLQVDDELNQTQTPPSKQLAGLPQGVSIADSLEEPDITTIRQNLNILPYPQYSNNFHPQIVNINHGLDGINNHANVNYVPENAPKMQGSTDCSPHLSCYPKDTVTASELMPREDPFNTWSQVNPSNQGHLADRNFLESGHHFGINTVGTSLQNANGQLRSDPPIPQIPVGPWLQSTIDPDTNRRQFEIGGDY